MTLEELVQREELTWLDLHLARTLARLAGERQESVQYAIALLSRAVREGDVCLDLANLEDKLARWEFEEPRPWPAEAIADSVANSALVGDGRVPTPLVLDSKGRLYLRRYWTYEHRVVRDLQQRASQVASDVTAAQVRPIAERLFPEQPASQPDWQLVATLVAVRRRLCVITGGPGTGKTYTAARILALLNELALRQGRELPRVALTAPTGKAAARLAQAIGEARGKLRQAIGRQAEDGLPRESFTIHRLLQPIGDSDTSFRFCADNPLLVDVVVVDECSMVDLALFAHLLSAMPPHARLILLGDEHQLASVEAGAVLGDICNRGAPRRFSKEQRQWLIEASGNRLDRLPEGSDRAVGLADCIVRLVHSHRYKEDGGIGQLAKAIQAGNAAEAWRVLQKDRSGALGLAPAAQQGEISRELREAVQRGFRPYLGACCAEARLREFEKYRVLCPHRHGPAGVSFLNRQIEATLAAAQLLQPTGQWYPQRPVLILKNHYPLRLFNGDLGTVVEQHRDGQRSWEVAFLTPEAAVRCIAAARLPHHQTAFAMTIHKSQGSEFEEVDVVLPAKDSPLLTRELLYTAITRAKERVVVHTEEKIFRLAVERQIQRSSGLRDGLWS